MEKKTAVLQPDPELLRRLEALVARTTLSPDEIVNDARRGYLDWQEDFARKVQVGVEAADRGAFASPAESEKVFEKYRRTRCASYGRRPPCGHSKTSRIS